MGIYSAEAANLLKEDYNNPDAAGLLEFAINSQKAEHAMFESMLEMDILEYHCESGSVVLTEEEKTNGVVAAATAIWKRIGEAVLSLIETLSKFKDNILNFVKSKIMSDKKIIEKYSSTIDLNKAKANKPDTKVRPVIDLKKAAKINDQLKTLTNAYDAITANAEKYNASDNADYFKSYNLDKYKSEVEKTIGSVDEYFENKDTIKDLTEADLNKIKEFVSGGYEGLVKQIILDETSKSIDQLKNVHKELKKLALKIGKNENRAVDSAKFKVVSNLNAMVTKVTNFGSRVAMTAMKNARLTYVAVGTASMTKEVKQESANVDYDDLFNYAFEVATENAYDEITFA